MRRPTQRTATILAITLLLSTFIPTPSVASNRTSRPVQLIETGTFHGDEIPARSGERWLGLYVSPDGSRLVRTEVRVTLVHDEIVDDEPGAMTGKRVEVVGGQRPVFLIRNCDALRPGRVTTVFDKETPLTNRSNIGLELAGTKYRLWVSTADRSDSPAIDFDDARLILEGRGRKQEIYSLEGHRVNEAYWSLLWAGDADGDGRLDLYVQVGDHYNAPERRLYLSSRASRTRLVRSVVSFVTYGC